MRVGVVASRATTPTRDFRLRGGFGSLSRPTSTRYRRPGDEDLSGASRDRRIHLLGAAPFGCHQEQCLAVRPAEHGGEDRAVVLDSLKHYGFADMRINGVRIVGHDGGTPGYEGQLDIYPDRSYVVVILTNQNISCATKGACLARMPSSCTSGTAKQRFCPTPSRCS